ncbi:Peptidoglycan D,D-transpeptidase MrdA [Pontiella desulfatans]|uniref:beta-lactamase n=1 Tax=Pontiella desulfatans TaxID=2750659 RepID=A0A6C2UAB6_PONDE|nr:penicillin-binding transpeptidase domain-containing protein [Pontiella desulfatans]VGO16935.1 Peptidoglycan D,D-transpeptidase MrdA [Pontiella desulfatans]
MKVRQQKRASSNHVIWAVFGLMVFAMGVLATNLWKLQVRAKGSFDDQLFKQSVRRIRLPAVRGMIYDRNGAVLADSVPNYCIAIYTEELYAPKSMVAKTLELVHEIWLRVGRKPDVSYNDIKRHLHFAPDKPLAVYKNLTPDEIRKWRIGFEQWTAPPKGWNKRYEVPGLELKNPVVDGGIVIHTAELEERATSTAANTLELVYKIHERLHGRVDMEKLPIGLQAIKRHINSQRPVPLLAWKRLDQKTIAKWADTCSDLTATDIYCLPDRTYPEGENLAHLIGFTREADTGKPDEQPGEQFHFDVRGIKGKKGLEGLYNELLEGEPGYQLVQIDADGFRHRDLQTLPSRPGGDLQLTIDRSIQQFAKEALTMHLDTDPFEGPVKGAVVVLDPNNGDVLAMVSSPLFDPNEYMASSEYVQKLMTDTNAPTLNRAVYGQYAPGSTFKPIACLGVLREHPEYADVHHDCPGYHMIGKRKMRCHARYGHGDDLSIRQTLEKSCNVYMFKMAIEVGYEPIYRMAKDFGLGQPVGLFPDVEDLSGTFMTKGNKYGNLPEKAVGLAGACNLSIGQGELIVAPLQMAMVAATIANGGHLYRPRLIKKFRFDPERPYDPNPTSKIRYIPIPDEALAQVRGGMHDVVMGGEEAAKCVQVDDIIIAGKTGTAEYGPKELGKKNTWMISYAPFHFPRYAIAFIVQDGVYGGTTVAPRLHELYSKIFHYDGTLKEEVL